MSSKFVSKLITLAAFVAIPAMAQFSINVSGGADGTKMDIKNTEPGQADLMFTGFKLVYLNNDPKIDGVKAQKDVSGKGNVWIVDTLAIKERGDLGGTEVCLSGVGRGGWAVVSGKVDKTKTQCGPLAANMALSVTVSDWGNGGGCFGLTPLAVKDGAVVKGIWVSHPDGPTNHLVKRASGETDMVTVLCVDATGKIAAPTDAQAKEYAMNYTKFTAMTTAKK